MGILNRKSKEEMDIETAMNIKMLKKKSEDHAKKCQNMAEMYSAKANEAKDRNREKLMPGETNTAKNNTTETKESSEDSTE